MLIVILKEAAINKIGCRCSMAVVPKLVQPYNCLKEKSGFSFYIVKPLSTS